MLPIAAEIIASRKANPEARRLALEEAAHELEWVARGCDAADSAVLLGAAIRVRNLIAEPQVGRGQQDPEGRPDDRN